MLEVGVVYVERGGFVERLTVSQGKVRKEKRSPEQKYGKYKWMRTLINRNSAEVREIKRMLRGLTRGLSYMLKFDSTDLVRIACKDSRDEILLDLLVAAGTEGLWVKTIYGQMRRYGLKYHHVTRRIKRMNRRMQSEIGRDVAVKVGRKWALSLFMLENYPFLEGEE